MDLGCWTQWFDRDDPTGTGDYEMLNLLRNAHPGKICANPVDIEARTLSGISAADTEDSIFSFNPTFGFACRKKDQPNGICKDYKVRFGTKCSDQQSDFLITMEGN
ncbi:hypothetical protein D4764_18G0004450 [Takifugu flavidus]|uniref:WxxW domain-containing protein n=1 Tax=Takifugu flavidus TaxID=433684 RepID=A0A5C6NSP9_9TELE|nr:hypothetical protein D4764_18G0004450 [Takifugu flavidus]